MDKSKAGTEMTNISAQLTTFAFSKENNPFLPPVATFPASFVVQML